MTAPIELDLDALVETANNAISATRGEDWRYSPNYFAVTTSQPGILEGSKMVADIGNGADFEKERIGLYIAAAQPAVVIELARRLRSAEQASKLSEEFRAGQWWVKELESAVSSGTDNQKRAVAVVHNLLRQVGDLGTLNDLDEDAMRAAGWVRAEKTIPAPPPIKPEPKCKECGDEMCGGTGIYEFRKCDGIPF